MPAHRRQRHSSSCLLVHLVWATHRRQPVLSERADAWLSWILPHIARDVGSVVLAVGNASDHVHVLARYPATLAISELARRLKGSSSHAWNGERPASSPRLCWQSGFWAESLSLPDLSRIERYLARQREHHRDGASPEAWQTALP